MGVFVVAVGLDLADRAGLAGDSVTGHSRPIRRAVRRHDAFQPVAYALGVLHRHDLPQRRRHLIQLDQRQWPQPAVVSQARVGSTQLQRRDRKPISIRSRGGRDLTPFGEVTHHATGLAGKPGPDGLGQTKIVIGRPHPFGPHLQTDLRRSDLARFA